MHLLPAVQRVLLNSGNLRLNTELSALEDGWLKRAEAKGHADEELAAVIKVLREDGVH